jgi:hypothetical protein
MPLLGVDHGSDLSFAQCHCSAMIMVQLSALLNATSENDPMSMPFRPPTLPNICA